MSENATETATPMRQRVAEEIRVLLARKRISASELARRMGVTQPYISRRLTGEIALDVDDLQRVARALDVPVTKLLPEVSLSWKIPATRRPRHNAVRTIIPAAAERFTGRAAHPASPRAPQKSDQAVRRLYRIGR